jgi:hypothetical protein
MGKSVTQCPKGFKNYWMDETGNIHVRQCPSLDEPFPRSTRNPGPTKIKRRFPARARSHTEPCLVPADQRRGSKPIED